MLENILKIIITNSVVLIIPGVNFSLVSYIAMKKGYRSAIASSIGIALAVVIHALLSMIGVSELLSRDLFYTSLLRILTGSYMILLGTKIFFSYRSKRGALSTWEDNRSMIRYFFMGFFVDIFNPYVCLFYISLFSGLKLTNPYCAEFIIYPLIIFSLVASWFIFISFLFSQNMLSNLFNKHQKKIGHLSGIVLIIIGLTFILDL